VLRLRLEAVLLASTPRYGFFFATAPGTDTVCMQPRKDE
jgi:hypothetical protein